MSKGGRLVPAVAKLFGDIERMKGFDYRLPSKLRVISNGEGSIVCELTVDRDLINIYNQMHGGCTATLMDIISSAAISTLKPIGVSVDLNISYMSAAKLGDDIVVSANTLKAGKSLSFLLVDIKRKTDGAVVAVGKATFYTA